MDNQYLQNRVHELEEQIHKLTQSMVGNKSHFAKYVEVKTENIALQVKY
jgi:regulator of replication initiation timing